MNRSGIRFRELPRQKQVALRELYRLNPWWNLKIALLFAIWAACAYVAIHVAALPLRVACYFLIAASMQGLGILMHEAVHGIMFRNSHLNRWIGFLCGLPVMLSVSAYRVGHLPHHRHERDDRDPDELENFSKNPRVLSLLFCLTFLFGELLGFHRVGPSNALQVRGETRRDVLMEYAIIVAAFIAVFALVPISLMLHIWVFPALIGGRLTNVRTLAEHVLTDRECMAGPTRTVVSSRFVSFFMCNLNYHIEHHLFPAVPWYNLPKLRALLGDELGRAGAQVYCSYTRFLLDLGRFMLKAWTSGGEQIPLRLPAR